MRAVSAGVDSISMAGSFGPMHSPVKWIYVDDRCRKIMKLDMLGLEAFVAIADQGRFGKAARQLHITQTALTRRLQNFEDLLGVKLVERTTRSVALTHIGRAFLPQARRLLTDLTAALVEIRETGKAQRGDVTIACVPTVGIRFLPRILKEYAAR